jgi:predicted phosphodiesterase
MSKVIIVGNGFDLAHDIKSSYSDFVLSLLKSYLDITQSEPTTYNRRGEKIRQYNDKLVSVTINYSSEEVKEIGKVMKLTELSRFIEATKKPPIEIKFNSSIIKGFFDNWADFELSYYHCLKKIRSLQEPYKSSQVNDLQSSFEIIRIELIKYLKGAMENWAIDTMDNQEVSEFTKLMSLDAEDRLIIINFNYTDTFKRLYLPKLNSASKVRLINIHGNINDHEHTSQIIFGYDDSQDEEFNEIIKKESTRFTKFFKTNSYLNSNSRMELENFLNLSKFEVLCMGHSFGQSDATILRRILGHSNCSRIRIFFNPKTGLEDFEEKCARLRKILIGTNNFEHIVSWPVTEPMPQPLIGSKSL